MDSQTLDLVQQILSWLFQFPDSVQLVEYVRKVSKGKPGLIDTVVDSGTQELQREKKQIFENLNIFDYGTVLNEFQQFQVLEDLGASDSKLQNDIFELYPSLKAVDPQLRSEVAQHVVKWKYLAEFGSAPAFLDEIPYLQSLVGQKVVEDSIKSLQQNCEKWLSYQDDSSEEYREFTEVFRKSLQGIGILPDALISEIISHQYGERSVLVGTLNDVAISVLSSGTTSDLKSLEKSLGMMLQIRYLRDLLSKLEVLRRLENNSEGQAFFEWLRSISSSDLIIQGGTLQYLTDYSMKLDIQNLDRFAGYVYGFFGSSDEFAIALGDVSGKYVISTLHGISESDEAKIFQDELIAQSADKQLCIMSLQLVNFILSRIPYKYV